jgi:predicted RNA methylase
MPSGVLSTGAVGETSGDGLFALCIAHEGNELIARECLNLTGATPEADGFVRCNSVARVPQSAYMRWGARFIAHAPTLSALVAILAADPPRGKDFRIDFTRLGGDEEVTRLDAIIAVANVLPDYPDLDDPKHVYQLVQRHDGFWFGEVVAECEHSYAPHRERPYRTSGSMPPRLARALVNIVSPPARSIVDPCCGTGTIVLEGLALGLDVQAGDVNARMVGMTRENAAHFGHAVEPHEGDAAAWGVEADAVVTNLPYGHNLEADEANVRAILHAGRRMAPVGVYVTPHDLTATLLDVGYEHVKVLRHPKHTGFRAGLVRLVHLAT